ncbi:unnamed protein product [Pneumocystis jirovecii]|uniref:Receptor L-domain domain-containing protein n=1 Tax=Pneumocystis jirovecii TaxID=42068 RepID=L0PHM2_PNEJI|nr:unnamed protein product [Pneumocystis jirovecii]
MPSSDWWIVIYNFQNLPIFSENTIQRHKVKKRINCLGTLFEWFLIAYNYWMICARTCSEDIYVKTQKDLYSLSECTVLIGDIYINSSISFISLDGIEEIDGSLLVTGNSDIVTFYAPVLKIVSGKVEFNTLTALEKISFPHLTSVNTLTLFHCARLESLQLKTGITSISKLTVSDTLLRELEGFDMKVLSSLDINNNNYLIHFNMSNLVKVRGPLVFMQNGQIQNRSGFRLSFPSLETIGDLTVQSVSLIEMDNLRNITGDFIMTLTSVKEVNLAIYNNSNLDTLDFPSLVSIGGSFLLSDNLKLTAITGFPQVSSIGGSVSWTGPLSTISLPSINDIKGTLKIISTVALKCPDFSKSRAIIQGANPICRSVGSETGGASRKGGSSSRKSGSNKFIGDLNFFIVEVICILGISHLMI